MFQEFEYCRDCGNSFPTGQLSNRGLCAQCAKKRVWEAFDQLKRRQGWIWDKWVRNYIAAMGGVLNRLRKEL